MARRRIWFGVAVFAFAGAVFLWPRADELGYLQDLHPVKQFASAASTDPQSMYQREFVFAQAEADVLDFVRAHGWRQLDAGTRQGLSMRTLCHGSDQAAILIYDHRSATTRLIVPDEGRDWIRERLRQVRRWLHL